MSDSPVPEGVGAAAFVVENRYVDPVTVAWSKVDVRKERLAECDPEIQRLKGKVAKYTQFAKDAKDAVDTAVAAKTGAKAALAEAQDELKAVETEYPDLAKETRARRKAQNQNRMDLLQSELTKLKGN